MTLCTSWVTTAPRQIESVCSSVFIINIIYCSQLNFVLAHYHLPLSLWLLLRSPFLWCAKNSAETKKKHTHKKFHVTAAENWQKKKRFLKHSAGFWRHDIGIVHRRRSLKNVSPLFGWALIGHRAIYVCDTIFFFVPAGSHGHCSFPTNAERFERWFVVCIEKSTFKCSSLSLCLSLYLTLSCVH